ncbi:MAG: hypothetical protein ACI4I4_04775 [Acutalibacteraceae bacterium]
MCKKTKKHIFRYIIIFVLVICAGVLCGFSLTQTGQSAFGRTMDLFKQNSTKQITLTEGAIGTVTYKETMNRTDTQAFARSDSYGTYDVYTDNNGDEYSFLTNSDLLCGYKAYDASDEMAYSVDAISSQEAREAADKFVSSVLGDDPREYAYEDILLQGGDMYYVTYVSCINGIKTDDECVVWVRPSNGEIAAWHAFNRGRYDGYENQSVAVNSAKARLEEQIPLVKSPDYEVFDQYITKTDDGKLVMHYDIVHTDGGAEHTSTAEIPLQ